MIEMPNSLKKYNTKLTRTREMGRCALGKIDIISRTTLKGQGVYHKVFKLQDFCKISNSTGKKKVCFQVI